MRDAIQELTPKAHGPRDTPQNRKLIRGPVKSCSATLEDWRTVIRRQLASVRSKPDAWKYLSLATLGRPVNFQRILDDAPSEAASPAKRPPVITWHDDLTVREDGCLRDATPAELAARALQ